MLPGKAPGHHRRKVGCPGGNFSADYSGRCSPTAKVAKEETFALLVPLFRFTDEADVIRRANDIEFGPAAYFYACDLSRFSASAKGAWDCGHQYRADFNEVALLGGGRLPVWAAKARSMALKTI